MKLANYKDGSTSGQLVVVSKDHSLAHYTTGIVNTLQEALDDWNFIGPQLQDLYDQLNFGKTKYHFAFQNSMCNAPLSRSYQHLWSPAFVSAQQLIQSPTTTENSNDDAPTQTQPLRSLTRSDLKPYHSSSTVIHQLASDVFLASNSTISISSQQQDVDLYPQISVILGDVKMACEPEQAIDSIRFLMLGQQIVFDKLYQQEKELAGPLMQSRVGSSFAPLALSLDELSDYWKKGRAKFLLQMHLNGKRMGSFDTSQDMLLHFGQLISFAASTRPLSAGTILSCGPISQLPETIKKQTDLSVCFSSIAEKRAIQKHQNAVTLSEFYRFNDVIKTEIKDNKGQSLFGAIELTIQDTHEAIVNTTSNIGKLANI